MFASERVASAGNDHGFGVFDQAQEDRHQAVVFVRLLASRDYRLGAARRARNVATVIVRHHQLARRFVHPLLQPSLRVGIGKREHD